jgi:hypothetical protein
LPPLLVGLVVAVLAWVSILKADDAINLGSFVVSFYGFAAALYFLSATNNGFSFGYRCATLVIACSAAAALVTGIVFGDLAHLYSWPAMLSAISLTLSVYAYLVVLSTLVRKKAEEEHAPAKHAPKHDD